MCCRRTGHIGFGVGCVGQGTGSIGLGVGCVGQGTGYIGLGVGCDGTGVMCVGHQGSGILATRGRGWVCWTPLMSKQRAWQSKEAGW